MSHITNRHLQLPNFLSLDFDPQQGLTVAIKVQASQPFNQEEIEKEVLKIMVKNTSAGTASGIAVGTLAAWWRNPQKMKERLYGYLILSSVVGATLGYLRGTTIKEKFLLSTHHIVPKVQASSSKAGRIINALIASQLDFEKNHDILCPISFQVMAFPVKTSCSPGVSHTFEYVHILKWLTENPTCPTCRRAVQIGSLIRDLDKEARIHHIASKIFKTMEAILHHLPTKNCGLSHLPDLTQEDEIIGLAERIRSQIGEGQSLLEGDENQLLAKMSQPQTLSQPEAYALAYFLVQQFSPMKKKIKEIYQIAHTCLVDLHDQGRIGTPLFLDQCGKLGSWYAHFQIVPDDCPKIKALYNL